MADRAAVIYAESLPQMSGYQQIGFRNFFRRSEAATRLVDLATKSQRPLELCSSTLFNMMRRTTMIRNADLQHWILARVIE